MYINKISSEKAMQPLVGRSKIKKKTTETGITLQRDFNMVIIPNHD